MLVRSTLFATALLLLPAGVRAQESAPDSLSLARQYTLWLYEGEADSLVAHSTENARQGFATAENFRQRSDMIVDRAGFEMEVIEETWKLRNGECQYWRTARFSNMDQPLLVRWVLSPEGEIAAAGLGPASQAPPVEEDHC